MGNEVGDAEGIDFPREGNSWSFFYARRQWSLCDNESLRYKSLLNFDKSMISLFAKYQILSQKLVQLYVDENQKVLIFARGSYIFAFNFHPTCSVSDFRFSAPAGKYITIIDSDSVEYDGFGRVDDSVEHFTEYDGKSDYLSLYLPNRTAIVLKRE